MGLTNKSTGINASETKLVIKKQSRNDKVVAIAGNPLEKALFSMG
ncbi:MAG: hypothetical protein ACLRQF_01615 [Thomasclavelia ramosa]